jgi:hypothetical protein
MQKLTLLFILTTLFSSGSIRIGLAQSSRRPNTPANPSVINTLEIAGPTGSVNFGSQVRVLANGNYLVIDTGFTDGANVSVGAVFLYSSSGTLISTLKGTTANDKVGTHVLLLANGDVVVGSPFWDNGATSDVGAVTWMNGLTGLNGTVSAGNSIIGSSTGDRIGSVSSGNTACLSYLPVSNSYVICSPNWDNGSVSDVGAVTQVSASGSTSAVVSAANSLTGSTADDRVGSSRSNYGNVNVPNYGAEYPGVRTLTNGNYVVNSSTWDDGSIIDAGAVTWCDAATNSCSNAAVGGANSLVGSANLDNVGNDFTTPLSNGNYIVNSSRWNSATGASTFANGLTGITGTINSTNSLIGGEIGDQVGAGTIIELTNGNYAANFFAVREPGDLTKMPGAVVLGSGTTGITGTISPTNALYGQSDLDALNSQITALSNGNFVLLQAGFDSTTTVNAGAVTWLSGTTPPTGRLTGANSVVGSTADDFLNAGITALDNGYYVLRAPRWDNGATADVGAVTVMDGTQTSNMTISAANSLVGATANDYIGSAGTRLSNGKFVIASPNWDDGNNADVGAVTVLDALNPITGTISAANSLIGSAVGDGVGTSIVSYQPTIGVFPSGATSFMVRSPNWDNGAIVNAGAVTWMSQSAPITGPVTAANSLVGSSANDNVGSLSISGAVRWIVLVGGWDNGATVNAGAACMMSPTQGLTGAVSSAGCAIGTSTNTNGLAVGSVSSINQNQWIIGFSSRKTIMIPYSGTTAGEVKLEGSIVSAQGRGIGGVKVTATNSMTGETAIVYSNNLGKFRLSNLNAGGSYIVSVSSSRRYKFQENTKSVQLFGDLAGMEFRALR